MINPGYITAIGAAALYAESYRMLSERKLRDFELLLRAPLPPTVCVSCGSSEFRLHGMRHVCAYCRTSSARSR